MAEVPWPLSGRRPPAFPAPDAPRNPEQQEGFQQDPPGTGWGATTSLHYKVARQLERELPHQWSEVCWRHAPLHLVLLLAHGPDAPSCTTPTHPSCQLTEVGACRKHALGRSELPAMQTVEVDAATGRSQTWQQMAAPSPQQKNSQGSYRLLHWSAFLPRTTLRTYMNQVPIKNWVRISNIDV